MARVQRERDRFVSFVLKAICAIAPSDRLTAKVSFQDANTPITEHGQLIHARRIAIATGSVPVLPPILKGLGANVLTNENGFDLPTLPTSLAVFGAGVLGLKLAQAVSRLGVRVKVFGMGCGIAGIQDAAIRDYANQTFHTKVYLDASAQVESVTETATGVEVSYLHRDGAWQPEAFAHVLAATGRVPDLAGLALDKTGLALNERGASLFDRCTLQCGDSTYLVHLDPTHGLNILVQRTISVQNQP